jgi:UDP-N-acetyl-D-glucosamine dehydrogenase
MSNRFDSLLARIVSKDALVGIVGLGYVGLPLAQAFVEGGFRVLGFDSDPHKVAVLLRGESYIGHLPASEIGKMAAAGFEPTVSPERLAEPDVILICVPTPLTEERDPDLSFVTRSTEAVAAALRPGQLVVLESTTYPGTTRQLVLPILERSGLRVGHEFFVAYSPEREDPGNPIHRTSNIPKVVGAVDPHSLEIRELMFTGYRIQRTTLRFGKTFFS